MRVLILANGESPSRETAQLLAAHHDITIATDGAIYAAIELGLTPDILTGDFDSVQLEVIRARYPNLRIIPTPDQDQSDLEKAVGVACDLGATTIMVIGAAGGRMDHTLSNTALLLRSRTPICLADDFGTVQAIVSDGVEESLLRLETSAGDTVSLITFEPDTGVSIEGVQWPLNCFHLVPGTRGVSNVAVGASVEIRVQRGCVFVCHLYEAPMRRHSQIECLTAQHLAPNTRPSVRSIRGWVGFRSVCMMPQHLGQLLRIGAVGRGEIQCRRYLFPVPLSSSYLVRRRISQIEGHFVL